MKPIVFEGRFGWLHPGEAKRGVILCNAFGHESVWSHKGIRRIAEGLSARGIPALRFDYLGTGDSVGVDGENDQLERCVADIGKAIAWFKRETGVTHVTLCGLRLGAAFALLAARRTPVDELVLLAPVVSGKSYVRELSVIRKTWLEQLAAPLRALQGEDAPLNVLGQVYSKQFQADLSVLDPARLIKDAAIEPASRALVFDIRPNASEPLRMTLTELGVQVECRPFDGYAEFQQETAFSVFPESVFNEAVDWMSGSATIDQSAARVSRETKWDANVVVETPEAREQPVRLGASGLFGILCKPRMHGANGPVLLITNTSASAHVGDSRLSVRIARDMARRGIASLRFDARGVGDSPELPDALSAGSTFSEIYSSKTAQDVAKAAAWLREQGHKKVVAFGICSGAYSAMRAALFEPALTGIITVNLPSFYVPEGSTAESLKKRQFNSIAGYGQSVLELSKWKKIISGERSPLAILRQITSQIFARIRFRVADAIGWKREAPAGVEGSPTDPRGIVQALQRKGVQGLLLYGAYDIGVDVVSTYFGKHGKNLSRASSVRVAVFDELDHALFGPKASETAMNACATFLNGMNEPVRQATAPRAAAGLRRVVDSKVSGR
jgi:pimeloyl-ACP methyl ester carboxylesterase